MREILNSNVERNMAGVNSQIASETKTNEHKQFLELKEFPVIFCLGADLKMISLQ